MLKLRIALLTFALFLPLQSQADFIKYKNYLIPIQSNCTQFDNDLPRVLYFDDVGVLPEDPNGVQELPIVAGLHNYKVNIVAMGTNSIHNGSYELVKDVMSRSVHSDIPLLDRNEIADRIIAEANCVPAGELLHVALGGEYDQLADALDADPSIASKIKAYGLLTSNGEDENEASYNVAKGHLGSNLVEIDFHNQETDEFRSRTQFYSNDPGVRHVFHAFYPRGSITESSLNNILFNQINTKLSGITDIRGESITSTNDAYLVTTKNWGFSEFHVNASSDLYLRIADFLTVAAVFLPLRDVYSTSGMHNLIEEATSRF